MAADDARMEDFAARGQEVDAQIKAGNLSNAVLVAVQNPPLNSKDSAIKVSKPRKACWHQFRNSSKFFTHRPQQLQSSTKRLMQLLVQRFHQL